MKTLTVSVLFGELDLVNSLVDAYSNNLTSKLSITNTNDVEENDWIPVRITPCTDITHWNSIINYNSRILVPVTTMSTNLILITFCLLFSMQDLSEITQWLLRIV